jgi:hypothetical protein
LPGLTSRTVAGTLAEDAEFARLRIGDSRRIGGQQTLRDGFGPLRRGAEIIFAANR